MSESKRRLQILSAGAVLLLMLGTLLSFFIRPLVEDAKVREALGDPDVTVTDTARSPWIYTDEKGVFTLYPYKILFSDTLIIPDVTNGYANSILKKIDYPVFRIRTVVVPKTIAFMPDKYGIFDDWLELETVVFAEGSTELIRLNFGNVPALKAVYLPASITYFKGLTVPDTVAAQLTVHYAGTEEEWLALGATAEKVAASYTMQYESAYEK
ncbi:MAG: hypothetical protein IJV96_00235 [Clostridia bacterium]|nr:hypothetical protein [Clostridia bacterium]